MTTYATIISPGKFNKLVEAAFQPEAPQVSSSESDLGEPLQHFSSPEEIRAKVASCAKEGIHSYAFALWYPSMKGSIHERKITLDPPREGKSFRYSLSGWGIIHLHLYFTAPDKLQCRVAVNTQARAESRESRFPNLGAASEWDWAVVETCAFRLSRQLATMGRVAPVVKQ